TAAGDAEHRLQNALAQTIQRKRRRLDVAAPALAPGRLRTRAGLARARFEALSKARDAALASRIEKATKQFGLAVAELDAMSPLKVLERGYAIAQDARGAIVREAGAVSIGEALRLRLWKGALDCRVEGANDN